MFSRSSALLYSPQCVGDSRVFELDGDKIQRFGLHTPALLSLEEDAWPTIEFASGDEDDSSSISSVSSVTGAVEKRSIFTAYWNKKGGKPKPQHEQTCSITAALTVDSDDDDESLDNSVNTYENVLFKNEADPQDTSSRRRLWGNNVYLLSQSEPSLAIPSSIQSRPIRKTKSASLLPRSSCLKECRYSGSSRRPSSAGKASVTFSDKVSTKYVSYNTENWAPSGWSEYFM